MTLMITDEKARPCSDLEPAHERRRLLGMMLSSAHAEVADVLTIIPTYGDPARIQTLRITLESLQRQLGGPGARVVIADNGLHEEQIAELRGHANALGISLHVSDARARQGGHRNAGYARNQALSEVIARGALEPWFRARSLLLIDDDVALLPNALERMQRGLASRRAPTRSQCAA